MLTVKRGLWLLLPVKAILTHLSIHSVTPIFTLSSVSGESLDLLKVFLNILPPLTNSKEQEELMQQLTEFQVVDPTNRREGQGRASPVVTA